MSRVLDRKTPDGFASRGVVFASDVTSSDSASVIVVANFDSNDVSILLNP